MIMSVPLSAIIMVAAAVFAVIGSGNTEESITRSPDVPRTLSSVSTTESSDGVTNKFTVNKITSH